MNQSLQQTKRTPKITRQLRQNEIYIQHLTAHKLANTLDTPKAISLYEAYIKLQTALQQRVPQQLLQTFNPTPCEGHFVSCVLRSDATPILIPQQDTQLSCNICNFPITSLLTTHHVIPKSKGGKFGPTVKLCATCHTMIHKCANTSTIDEGIYAYYAPIDGAITKIEMYINNIHGA